MAWSTATASGIAPASRWDDGRARILELTVTRYTAVNGWDLAQLLGERDGG